MFAPHPVLLRPATAGRYACALVVVAQTELVRNGFKLKPLRGTMGAFAGTQAERPCPD